MGILKLKRGTEANRTSFTPAEGEIILTTDTNIIYVGDGTTAGGNAVGSGSGGALTGGVVAVGFSSIPTGYLECNGSAISRTTYADLFSAISTSYGVGNGSTTFNIPDLRGEFIRGFDNGRGVDSGRSFGSFQADEFKSHTHGFKLGTNTTTSTNFARDGRSTSIITAFTYATGGSETRPRNLSMMYVIKY